MTGGVDTLSLAWRPRSEDVFERFREQAHHHGPVGSLILAERGPGDERVILFPSHGVLSVEGRLGAALARSGTNHDLLPAQRLPDARRAWEGMLRDRLGFEPGGVCEVRRYDLASEVIFEDGRDGLAMLRTLGGMCPAGARLEVVKGADGQPQTVYIKTPKRWVVQQRFYDKGVESGSHPAGQRLRLEAQMRPPKAKRYQPEVLASLDLRTHFIKRMESYVTGTNATGVVAAGTEAAVSEILGSVAREELSMAKAERLIGSMVVLREFGRAAYEDRQGR